MVAARYDGDGRPANRPVPSWSTAEVWPWTGRADRTTLPAECFGNRLVAQQTPRIGSSRYRRGRFGAWRPTLRRARPRRQHNGLRSHGAVHADRVDRVVAHDARPLAQPLEIAGQVMHETIVVVDEKNHCGFPIAELGDRCEQSSCHGDLTRLACDALLIPCDSSPDVNPDWRPILPEGLPRGRGRWLRLPDNGKGTGVITLDDNDGRKVRAFVVVDHRGVTPESAVHHLWDAIGQVSPGLESKDGRVRPLIGVPLPGTGDGGLRGRRGEVIDALLQQHRDAGSPCDIALVLWDRRDFAAIQNRRHPSSDWPELGEEIVC